MIWNNLMFARHQQMANQRPLILSRYGGLGNHRAPLGFSGDSHACWQTLKYQIGFTSTAANVLQMWSHDLGGFYAYDDGDPTNATGSELLLRWLQFGAVSPVFRTHCSGVHDGPHCLRRIWLFPHYELMKSAMVMRDAMLPYLMTAYRHFHDSGVGLVHPCYYEHSQEPQAYATAEKQYMFGTEMLAAPITDAAPDPLHGSVEQTVWLPPGVWVEWGGERVHVGPANYTRSYTHSELPLFVKGGSAIPMKAASSSVASDLCWVLFPLGGRAGSGVVYDDEGEGPRYQQEEYSTTRLSYHTANWSHGAVLELKLQPLHRCAGAGCAAWAIQRSHSFALRGLSALGLAVQSVDVESDSHSVRHTDLYDAAQELVTLPGRWDLKDRVVAKLRLARSGAW
jgi:alpha-glucosidase